VKKPYGAHTKPAIRRLKMRHDFKDRLRTESNFKFIAAACLVLGFIGVIIFTPRGKDFNARSQEEVKIAMQICQASKSWVQANRSHLKLGNASKLDNIPINGNIPEFKYTKTPQVIFISSGFNSPNMTNNMFCEVINPMTKQKLYYDYEKGIWRNKIRFRR